MKMTKKLKLVIEFDWNGVLRCGREPMFWTKNTQLFGCSTDIQNSIINNCKFKKFQKHRVKQSFVKQNVIMDFWTILGPKKLIKSPYWAFGIFCSNRSNFINYRVFRSAHILQTFFDPFPFFHSNWRTSECVMFSPRSTSARFGGINFNTLSWILLFLH